MNANIKRITAVLLCCAVLSGCQAQTATSSTESTTAAAESKATTAAESEATTAATEATTTAAEATTTAAEAAEKITDTAEAALAAMPAENQVTLEGQSIGLEGVSNARELGGYITEDGRSIKRGILLRSGKLAEATTSDLAKLREEYNLTEVLDLRTTAEIEAAPDPEIEGVENTRVKVLDEESAAASAAVSVYSTSDNPAASLLEMYRNGILTDDMYTSMFESDVSIAGYRSFIDELLSHEDGAILWHCTGGKDRAGTATVILLTLLGVDKETTLQDFELTNEFNSASIAYMEQKAAELTDDQTEIDGVGALVGVSRELMEKLYEYAEGESGSMLQFLKDKLNITDEEITALRDKYLE